MVLSCSSLSNSSAISMLLSDLAVNKYSTQYGFVNYCIDRINYPSIHLNTHLNSLGRKQAGLASCMRTASITRRIKSTEIKVMKFRVTGTLMWDQHFQACLQASSQNCEQRLLDSSCLSVCLFFSSVPCGDILITVAGVTETCW